MLTAVELLHPDKARPEMFVYEVGVDDAFRRRGVASALLRALRDLAVTRGCGEQWVLTDEANAAALATYGRAGGAALHDQVLFTWHLTDPEAEDRGHDEQG